MLRGQNYLTSLHAVQNYILYQTNVRRYRAAKIGGRGKETLAAKFRRGTPIFAADIGWAEKRFRNSSEYLEQENELPRGKTNSKVFVSAVGTNYNPGKGINCFPKLS